MIREIPRGLTSTRRHGDPLPVDEKPAMSTCGNCGAQYPVAPVGAIHKCGRCSGGIMKRPGDAPVSIDIVGYGGAAGGGKSYAVQTLVDTSKLEAEIMAVILSRDAEGGLEATARRILKIERIAKALRYMEEHEKVFSQYTKLKNRDA